MPDERREDGGLGQGVTPPARDGEQDGAGVGETSVPAERSVRGGRSQKGSTQSTTSRTVLDDMRTKTAESVAYDDAEEIAKTSQSERRNTVLSGTRWSVGAQIATEMSRMIVQLVLARLLIPADFGIVTLGMATIVFLDIFATLGTAPTIVQRPTINQRLLHTMFIMNIALGVVTTALFFMAAPFLASAADQPDATSLLRTLGCALMISSVGMVHQGLIRRQLSFARLARANIVQTLVSGVMSVALAVNGFGAWSLVWGQLAGRAVLVFMMWRAVSYRPRLQFDRQELLTVRQYSLNRTAFDITNYFFLTSDRFFVGGYLGSTALGIYGLGQQTLMTPVRSITRAVQQVLFPTFARMQDDAAMGRGYLRACAAISAITFPAMAGLAVLAGPLIRTLFDDQWLDAIPVVTILAPVGLLHSLHFTVGVIYNAKGRADWQFRWGIGSGIITVIAYIAGLPWGITGVAISYAIAVLILTYPAFAIPFSLIDLKFRNLVAAVMPYSLATLVMAAAVWASRWMLERDGVHESIVLLVGVAVGMVSYGSWLFLAKPLALQDLMGIVRKKSKSQTT